MGSLTSDVMNFHGVQCVTNESPSVPREAADGDLGHDAGAPSQSQPNAATVGHPGRVSSASPLSSVGWLLISEEVRRLAEKLDRLDRQAEQIRACVDAVLRWSLTTNEECSPISPLLARVE